MHPGSHLPLIFPESLFSGVNFSYIQRCTWKSILPRFFQITCLYQPTSLAWRTTKSPSPDFLLLLESQSLVVQVVQWWSPQMSSLPPPISSYLKGGSTKTLAMMTQGISLKPAFLPCAHSENGQYQQSASSLISWSLLKEFTRITCVSIIGVYSYVVVLFRPQPMSRKQLVLWRRWSSRLQSQGRGLTWGWTQSHG